MPQAVGRALRKRSLWVYAASVASLFVTGNAHGDVPISLHTTWSGAVDFYATGAPMAVDGPDVDTNVDMIAQPASVTLAASTVPAGSQVIKAFLYWSGTIGNTDCVAPIKFDDTVDFMPPGAPMPLTVKADICYCSTADATSYDVQVCRADVTSLVEGPMVGSYIVDKFAASIGNGATDNASFSIVLVYQNPILPPRDIALYDGIEGLSSAGKAITTFSLGGIRVDSPAQGDLTWYTVEGDVGGGAPGAEQVVVTGNPGGVSLSMFDAINPVNNPMNRTINTTTPVQTGVVGVDIDRFDISSALTPGDTSVDMLYSAHSDKWWIAYNIVGINVFEPVFAVGSRKTGVLRTDADGNGVPTAGDTLRYTIHMNNTGTDAGRVNVVDSIPPQAASWWVVSTGGGINASTTNQLVVQNVFVALQGSADIVFDMVLADVPDQTVVSNVANFDATPDGDQGWLTANNLVVRRDGDKDGVWDNGDNCPITPNPNQSDNDGDGRGDVCDPCPFDNLNDIDGDKVCADDDNCPVVANENQQDSDNDKKGDACDVCPFDAADDSDGDTFCANVDNCPAASNPGQEDTDKDGIGDACDNCLDVDADMACDNVDNCPGLANPGQMDTDGDGLGNACDDCVGTDVDGDGVCEATDNCPGTVNADQADKDGDGKGDLCDVCSADPNNDIDQDGICGDADNCPADANAEQFDTNGNGIGDICDTRPTEQPVPPVNEEGGCACRAAGAPNETSRLGAFFALVCVGIGRRLRRRA